MNFSSSPSPSPGHQSLQTSTQDLSQKTSQQGLKSLRPASISNNFSINTNNTIHTNNNNTTTTHNTSNHNNNYNNHTHNINMNINHSTLSSARSNMSQLYHQPQQNSPRVSSINPNNSNNNMHYSAQTNPQYQNKIVNLNSHQKKPSQPSQHHHLPNHSQSTTTRHFTLDPNRYSKPLPSLTLPSRQPISHTIVSTPSPIQPMQISVPSDHTGSTSSGANTPGGNHTPTSSVGGSSGGLNFPRSMKRKNFKKLSLGPEAATPPQSATPRLSENDSLISKMNGLELDARHHRIKLSDKDFEVVRDLGSGNGGTVAMVKYIPNGQLMARKRIAVEQSPATLKNIKNELVIMNEVNSPYIVGFYGHYITGNVVVMCLEYMDKGSLDNISRKHGPIPEPIIGKITVAVVEGLDYLYTIHHIMHRDIKPSNVLVNSKGHIKLCDFGVSSSELVNSMAETFVGTSTYMSPERILGGKYTVRSDVWSLGITLLELALGHFPEWSQDDKKKKKDNYNNNNTNGNNGNNNNNDNGNDTYNNKHDEKDEKEDEFYETSGIIALLQKIINEKPPSLQDQPEFSTDLKNFIDLCLLKEASRPMPSELKMNPFYVLSKRNSIRLDLWAQQL